MPGQLKVRHSPRPMLNLIVDEGIDPACVTKAWVTGEADVNLQMQYPPDFGVQHPPRVEGWGGGVAVFYRGDVLLNMKPIKQLVRMECL